MVAAAMAFAGRHWKALLIAGLVGLLAVQTARVGRLKNEVAAEQAAQINPATKRPWKYEAERDGKALLTCQGNVSTLDGALSRQSAAVAAKSAADQARISLAERGLAEARAANAKAAGRIAELMRPLAGADTCTRVIEVDERLLRSLQ